jgi:amidase
VLLPEQASGLQDAQDGTAAAGRSDGHPWGDPAAAAGEIRWPPMGRISWPPSPIAHAEPGQLLDVFTDDAFGSRIQSEGDLPSKVLHWPYVNPQTGPIHVQGAEPGDTLVVEILEIEPTRDFAASATIPYFGALTCTDRTALNEPLPERVFIYRVDQQGVHLPRGVVIRYAPFLGTLATAPQIEAVSTLQPGPFGGNMDVADVCPGNVVRLPVWVEGAYLFLGDAHAAQGDGELCGVACEITAWVRLRLGLEKQRQILWPRIESENELMAVGSARPMEDAARIAWSELIAWLVDDYGFDRWEAYQLLMQAGRMRVGNMVDPNYSLVAKIDKRYLGG